MEDNKRVYPQERQLGKWFSYLLLFLSAVIVISGLIWRGNGDGLSIEMTQTPTPIPTDAYFDETPEQREVTLPSATWYALQLGAFESETAAGELAQQFTLRGAAGYVWNDGRYRVLAALYPTQEDAQLVRRQLSEQHMVDSYLYQISLPSLHVRLSGMKGQLDILEAAFAQANALVSSAQAVGIQLDRQETSAAEAVALLKSLCEQTDMMTLRLKQRFSQPVHSTVSGLILCFEDYAAFCGTLSSEDSEVSLSTKLKWQTFSTLHILNDVYDALSNT